jgi:hypothetical protein
MRTMLAWALAVGVAVFSAGARAQDGGCAKEVLGTYLSELGGYEISAFEAGDGGARVILHRDAEPAWLLVSVGLEGTKLHTFTLARGGTDSSEVPPAVAARMGGLWDRLWKDPRATGCAQLSVAAAPDTDRQYKALEALYATLQPADPPLTDAPEAADTGSAWLWVLLGLAIIGLCVYWAFRGRKGKTPVTPAEAPSQTPVAEAGTEPPAAEPPSSEPPASGPEA